LERARQSKSPSRCCTVGKFASFHEGHRALIERAKRECEEVLVVVIKRGEQLFTEEERKEIAQKLGVSLIELPFERVKELSPEEFFRFLKELGCQKVVVGKEWRFGKGRSGTVETARKLGKALGIEVVAVEPIKRNGQKVSTSKIVELLKAGRVEEANSLLGFNYFAYGKVARGKKLGRRLGFPTLNLKLKKRLPLPFGVYAVKVKLNGKELYGLANFGLRPTVEERKEPVLEVHVPEVKLPELYGKRVKVEFLSFIRGEKRFNSLEDLTNQIKLDLKKLQKFLEERVGREEKL